MSSGEINREALNQPLTGPTQEGKPTTIDYLLKWIRSELEIQACRPDIL
jgi:hypothetical protein